MAQQERQDSARPRVLLLGNGINRMTQGNESWEKMMDVLEKPIVDSMDPNERFKERGERIPGVFRVQRAMNYIRDDTSLDEWIGKLDEMRPNGCHDLLAGNAGQFDAILTTNYDHLLENALEKEGGTKHSAIPVMSETKGNLFRFHVVGESQLKIYHLHGEVGCKESMLCNVPEYLEEVSRLVQYSKKVGQARFQQFPDKEQSWLDYFIHSELHICGLSFGYDELTLWYALQKRVECYGPGMGGAYIYVIHTPEEQEEVLARASVFKSFGVKPVLIPVPTGLDGCPDYESAWQHLIGALLLNINHTKLSRKTKRNRPATPSTPDGVDSDDLIPFQYAWPRRNVSVATSVSNRNTERCKFQLSHEKLGVAVSLGIPWFFDILIHSQRFTYSIEAKELQAVFNDETSTPAKDGSEVCFYIEFRTGAIYSKSTDALDKAAKTLTPVVDAADFNPEPVQEPKPRTPKAGQNAPASSASTDN